MPALQQAFGKYPRLLMATTSGSTRTMGFDLQHLFGATPIFFPVEWHNSKIPGYAIRASVPNFHGFSALRGNVQRRGTILHASG